jgi:hypothetical protein
MSSGGFKKGILMAINTYAYIDGYNLYNGIMEPERDRDRKVIATPLGKYRWLNLSKYISTFLPTGYDLVKIHYFTATVRGRPDSKRRQQVYWKALETLSILEQTLGDHVYDPKRGEFVEKQSDVNIALQMYSDAIEYKTNSMVLVSGDSDQIPTIRRIQNLNRGIELFAIFPPRRFSQDIADAIPRNFKTREPTLRDCQFPDIIKIEGRPDIIKPPEWS